ncbi:unnamed protein product [Schistosoma curassoni]|uniref:DUF3124 domain-containing protein n=1 Tax=Schistosoma curassoni TaxID=6186 RepID=A0A183JR20_9TREM|nr:unnamed protein product [Schistosoma curassoni]
MSIQIEELKKIDNIVFYYHVYAYPSKKNVYVDVVTDYQHQI